MFVTSDTFDLATIGRFRDFEWRENLVCGIDVHGTAYRGYQADAAFMLVAAELCGLLPEMKWASYSLPGERRSRPIKPTSFERLARGKLAAAAGAEGVFISGERDAVGSYRDAVIFEGASSACGRGPRTLAGRVPDPHYPYRAFDAQFDFPINETPRETGTELLRQSAAMLDAEYGYFFARDDLCFPSGYASGVGAVLDYSKLAREESFEVAGWRRYVTDGALWTDAWPKIRDLFEVNLISERHTSVRIEGLGYLTDWIAGQSGRGELEDIGRGRLLWSLSDAEMLEVRPVLNEAGLLLTCRKRVYRDLTPGFRARPSPWQKPRPTPAWLARS